MQAKCEAASWLLLHLVSSSVFRHQCNSQYLGKQVKHIPEFSESAVEQHAQQTATVALQAKWSHLTTVPAMSIASVVSLVITNRCASVLYPTASKPGSSWKSSSAVLKIPLCRTGEDAYLASAAFLQICCHCLVSRNCSRQSQHSSCQ